MAIKQIATNTNTLDRDTDYLENLLRQIRGEIDGMYDAVRVLNTMWEGPANEAFVRQFNGDCANMQAFCEAVEALIRCMRNARTAYNRAEQQVDSLVASIRI